MSSLVYELSYGLRNGCSFRFIEFNFLLFPCFRIPDLLVMQTHTVFGL